jgi:solute carrier family 25 protein 42
VDIARKEGVAGGLYKGVAMNWVKGPASVAVSFYVNDWVKSRFGEWRERNEEETP